MPENQIKENTIPGECGDQKFFRPDKVSSFLLSFIDDSMTVAELKHISHSLRGIVLDELGGDSVSGE